MLKLLAIPKLALHSVANRRASVLLTLFSVAVSVALVVSIERLRVETKESFANTVSGTDLIVGARSSPLQLLLYAVFRIGNPTNNLSWETYQAIASSPLIEWSIPISLGDSHRGFRVVGTTPDYFAYYEYGDERALTFSEGRAFEGLYDTTIGAVVAAEFGYEVGQKIIIAHGLGSTSFAEHDDHPFTITGIIAPTGTPVDRTVHVSLAAIEAIHDGNPTEPGGAYEPSSITAFFVGLNSRLMVFRAQRGINAFADEPLTAIMPSVALTELWGLVGVAERALIAISLCVTAAGLLGLLASILMSLNERRREMAVLRAVGARPIEIFGLLISEAAMIAAAGAALGVLGHYLLFGLVDVTLADRIGIDLSFRLPGLFDVVVVIVVTLAATLLAIWPALQAYRNTLADGLTPSA